MHSSKFSTFKLWRYIYGIACTIIHVINYINKQFMISIHFVKASKYPVLKTAAAWTGSMVFVSAIATNSIVITDDYMHNNV